MPILRGVSQILVASSAKTTSSNSGVLIVQGSPDTAQFILNVTASSSPTTLDVYLQTSPNTGTTWYDFAHFTQVGAVATSIQTAQWSRKQIDATQGTQVIVTGDAALAAAKVINGPIADNFVRVKWVVAGTSYTFSVTAIWDED